MLSQQSLEGAQSRLVQHYIGKLQQADTAAKRGKAYRSYWLNEIDKDWSQIKTWQDWSATWNEHEVAKAKYCVSFIMSARIVLEVRQTTPEHITWLLPALHAARQLEDTPSERYILAALGHAYFLLGNMDEAHRHLHQLLDNSHSGENDINVGHAYITLGAIQIQSGNFDDAEAAIQKSLHIFENLHETLNIGRALHRLGQIAQASGDYQRAYDYHSRYLALVEGSGREEHIAVALDALSMCFRSMRDFETSKAYAMRVIDICKRIGYTRMLPNALFSLGSCEIELGNLEASSQHYAEGVELARINNNLPYCVGGLDNLGYIHTRLGNYEKALAYFNEGLTLADENQVTLLSFELRYDITDMHIVAGDLGSAKKALKKLLEITTVMLETERHKAKALSPAVTLWYKMGDHIQSAIWAGLLMQYTQHLDLSLFEPVCAALENELGTQAYHQALEQGTHLTLDATLQEVSKLLD